MSKLRIENLCLHVGKRTLVKDLSVNFDEGQNWAVLGANGSGKTTLLHSLAGLRQTDAGHITLDGQSLDVMGYRDRARQIGIVFQDSDAGFPSSVFDTVMSGRHPHFKHRWFGAPSAIDVQKVNKAIHAMDLDGLAHRSITELSGGERRRVDIAVLLTQEPCIRILDEPVNHLDLRHQTDIFVQLTGNGKYADQNQINIIALHDINLAFRFCDHGLLLFEDGNPTHGPLKEVATKSELERLFRCQLSEIRTQGGRVYIPETMITNPAPR